MMRRKNWHAQRAKTCTNEMCIHIATSNGLCVKHSPTHNDHDLFVALALSHDSDECLQWPYGSNPQGYGATALNGKNMSASRRVCIEFYGVSPEPKMDAAHSCHNPQCVNPRHLRWATRRDNIADRVADGTNGKVLTNDDVQEIRKLLPSETQTAIAKMFGVDKSTIHSIARGKRWANLPHIVADS